MPTPALTAAVHGVPPAAGFTVEVAYSPRAGEVEVVAVHVAASATVADALRASGLLRKHGLDEATVRAGVWCKPKELSTPLRERDRVEIYRPLRVDPKEARRQRYKSHLEKTASRSRAPGAKGAAG